VSLTLRNWLIGYYIVEFEQNGEDRAKYGEKLLQNIEKRLNTKGLNEKRFREYRRIYMAYPQIGEEIANFLPAETIRHLSLADSSLPIRQTLSGESENVIRRPVVGESENVIRRTLSGELKVDKFRHEYASQLNMYLNYFRHEEMAADDNPPVGILLCTEKGNTQVQYATAGLDEHIFVQKYLVELPDEKTLEEYITKEFYNNYKEKTLT
jgi:hypothetical protein